MGADNYVRRWRTALLEVGGMLAKDICSGYEVP